MPEPITGGNKTSDADSMCWFTNLFFSTLDKFTAEYAPADNVVFIIPQSIISLPESQAIIGESDRLTDKIKYQNSNGPGYIKKK